MIKSPCCPSTIRSRDSTPYTYGMAFAAPHIGHFGDTESEIIETGRAPCAHGKCELIRLFPQSYPYPLELNKICSRPSPLRSSPFLMGARALGLGRAPMHQRCSQFRSDARITFRIFPAVLISSPARDLSSQVCSSTQPSTDTELFRRFRRAVRVGRPTSIRSLLQELQRVLANLEDSREKPRSKAHVLILDRLRTTHSVQRVVVERLRQLRNHAGPWRGTSS